MSDVVSVFQDLDTAYQKKTIKLLQSKHSQVYLALFRALFPDTSQGMVADKLWSRMDECLRDLEEAGCADLLPKEGGKTKRGRSVCHDLIDRYNWVESKRREDGQMEYRLTSDAVEALETVERLRATNTVICLGDNGQALPAFAPVFLDEAFIKADERFTRRTITALTGLGFQVIIAVPTSKVQAVEPVATEYACVTKDPVSNHSFVTEMTAVRTHA